MNFINDSNDLKEVQVPGRVQHLHHGGLQQEGEGQEDRAAEVHEETQEEVRPHLDKINHYL